jgi:hypothetical protein
MLRPEILVEAFGGILIVVAVPDSLMACALHPDRESSDATEQVYELHS